MLQRGQSGSGGGLHVFGRHCFSAWPDDTDRWFECDSLPTVVLQGVSQRVRQTKRSAATSVSEKKSFCGSPFERRRFPPVCVDVADKRDCHQCKKRGTLANIGQEQEEQVKRSRLDLALEKDDPRVTHSGKMHRPPMKTLMQKPGLVVAKTPSHSPWGKQAQTLTFTTCQRTSAASSSTHGFLQQRVNFGKRRTILSCHFSQNSGETTTHM